ncbi:hypothetical protein CXB51_009676 [Gossypium anomalum]|uniref:Uncharacterized protein n=1 Tax=Gossypium anomalum TaxID=47600 RepID=A0A8J6D5V0_9ROSI|nr:hypothetical protein CXB51_009676 [Gossypium anomalum]
MEISFPFILDNTNKYYTDLGAQLFIIIIITIIMGKYGKLGSWKNYRNRPRREFCQSEEIGLSYEGLKSFISNPTTQLSGHSSHSGNVLEKGRVVLVMMSKATNEVLERRGGILALKQIVRLLRNANRDFIEQNDKEIMREIEAIMTQIASTITYLPCLDEPCKSCIRVQFFKSFSNMS